MDVPPRQAAVLDACVLFKGTLTDFLLRAARIGLFEPIWSDRIRREWPRNLHRDLGIPQDKVEQRRAAMDAAFPGATRQPAPNQVTEVESFCVTDAQRKDAHVTATAVAADVVAIVTDNVKDFPLHISARYGLRRLTPDAFCCELYVRHAELVVAAARNHRASLRRTPYTQEGYLGLLAEKAGLPETAGCLKARLHEL